MMWSAWRSVLSQSLSMLWSACMTRAALTCICMLRAALICVAMRAAGARYVQVGQRQRHASAHGAIARAHCCVKCVGSTCKAALLRQAQLWQTASRLSLLRPASRKPPAPFAVARAIQVCMEMLSSRDCTATGHVCTRAASHQPPAPRGQGTGVLAGRKSHMQATQSSSGTRSQQNRARTQSRTSRSRQ
jgi:hypothetical protein